ncbi:coiled-coil domain-containing protein 138-like [Eucyclogobius newberryi]|uniref:coiled-coil domain-containing protein 138-like n=1 Tax=Eucyclogobius newberryi TaxID=166745 RepID=UPI003B5A47C4
MRKLEKVRKERERRNAAASFSGAGRRRTLGAGTSSADFREFMLERQSRKVQARLENLQRKYELGVALRGCQKMDVKSLERVKPPQKDKTVPRNISKVTPSAKLLSLLLDWVLDAQLNSSTCERCLKALPLLADQLSRTPLLEAELVCSLLRLIHRAVRHLDNSAQHVALSATLRRIEEEVSKPRSHLQSEDPETEEVNEPGTKQALYRSPCPETRVFCVLIVLQEFLSRPCKYPVMKNCRQYSFLEHKAAYINYLHLQGVFSSTLFFTMCTNYCVINTVSSMPDATALVGLLSEQYQSSDVLTRALDGLRSDLLHGIVDALMQLTQESIWLVYIHSCGNLVNLTNQASEEKCLCLRVIWRVVFVFVGYLKSFTEAGFFHTASQVLRSPHLELSLLEKLYILQKLSTIRKNRRLFESSALLQQIEELQRRFGPTHTFLCLNLHPTLSAVTPETQTNKSILCLHLALKVSDKERLPFNFAE